MAISSATITSAPQHGIRPIDLHRDLGAIADLIDEAFSDELDAAGRASLQDMRTMARLGPLIYLMAPPGNGSGYFRGYVWEEEGQIVGNVTIQQADGYGRRWMIANVAVQKAYRGRGIARALMEQALNRIRQNDGEWAVLQVRQNNEVARTLYDHLGFSEVLTETQLRRETTPVASSPTLPPSVRLTLLRYEDWKSVQKLLRQTLPELARWYHPDRSSRFRNASSSGLGKFWGQISGQGYRQRLGLFLQDELQGVLDVDVRPRGEHRLDLLLHPDAASAWDDPLLRQGFSLLGDYVKRPVTATLFDYQPEAVAAAQQLGLRPATVLVTMRKRIIHHSERYR